MTMSTFHMTASAADVRLETSRPSIFARLADMVAEYRARLACTDHDGDLTRYSDEELREMGYNPEAVARIRNAHSVPAQYWF